MKLFSAVVESKRNHRIWANDAWLEVRGQFRRSTLGPLWISINGVFFTIGIVLVFSKSSTISINQYVFYVYTGIWTWQLIQSVVLQGSLSLVTSAPNLLNLPLHPLIYIVQSGFKQIITWLFGVPLYIFLAVLTQQNLNFWFLFAILNILIAVTLLCLLQVVLSYLCLRYRDFHQLIVNIMQLMFFVTPIIWIPDDSNQVSNVLTTYNPLFWIIDSIREPLRFSTPDAISQLKMFVILIGSLVIASLGIKHLEKAAKYV